MHASCHNHASVDMVFSLFSLWLHNWPTKGRKSEKLDFALQ